MDKNILKNEFMWEEEKKKKLYKNWKLYAITLGIIAISLSVGLGVGLNIHHNPPPSTIVPINLDNLKNNIDGTEELMNATDGQIALQTFIINNTDYSDLENNVEITSWIAPTYTSQGKLILEAKTNSKKYTGTITVTINALEQINLNQLLNLNTKIDEIVQDSETAFNLFVNNVNNTNNYPDLKDNIEAGTFNLNWGTIASTLEINAKVNTKYTGSITVEFLGQEQINISEIFNTEVPILGTEDMLNDSYNSNLILESFLNPYNENYPDLKDNVEIKSFNPPSYISNGSLEIKTITNDGKYYGSVLITIKAIGQTKLSDLNLNTTFEESAINQNDAWDKFLNANSNITDLANNIEVKSFTPSDYDQAGLLQVQGKENSKYATDSIDITFAMLTLSEQEIINGINQINYQIQTVVNSSAESVTQQISNKFIQNQLTDEIAKEFDSNKFQFNQITIDGNSLIDNNLLTVITLDAKINYDYGSIIDQNTNLIININPQELTNIFKDFQFKDEYDIKNFLNSTDQTTIARQISDFLNISSLSTAGLTLENQTSNSIVLKATEDAQNYQGEVRLTWNLKLFEIWGITTDLGITDPKNSQAEIKGYFYLDNNNQIKYFDVYGYKKPGESTELSRYDVLHTFVFENENGLSKTFKFEITQKTDEIAEQFDSFDFTNDTTVTITSVVYANVRTYDSETNQWKGLNDYPTIIVIKDLIKM